MVLWFRRINFLRITIRVISVIATLLEASIFFIVASAILLFFLPIAVLVYFGAYIAALLFRRRANRKMAHELSGRHVYVFFADRERGLDEGSYFIGLAGEFARSDGSASIIVTPYVFSPVGLGERSPYLNIKKSRDGIYICRRTSFFSLRRAVLSRLDTTYFY